jgi:hypothetical protein
MPLTQMPDNSNARVVSALCAEEIESQTRRYTKKDATNSNAMGESSRNRAEIWRIFHVACKAPGDWRSPRRFAYIRNHWATRSVLECGGPPPLLRSGGHPACRRAGASRSAEKTLAHTNHAGKFQNCTQLPSFFPGSGTPALYGRRDVCRYNAFAAFFQSHGKLRQF